MQVCVEHEGERRCLLASQESPTKRGMGSVQTPLKSAADGGVPSELHERIKKDGLGQIWELRDPCAIPFYLRVWDGKFVDSHNDLYAYHFVYGEAVCDVGAPPSPDSCCGAKRADSRDTWAAVRMRFIEHKLQHCKVAKKMMESTDYSPNKMHPPRHFYELTCGAIGMPANWDSQKAQTEYFFACDTKVFVHELRGDRALASSQQVIEDKRCKDIDLLHSHIVQKSHAVLSRVDFDSAVVVVPKEISQSHRRSSLTPHIGPPCARVLGFNGSSGRFRLHWTRYGFDTWGFLIGLAPYFASLEERERAFECAVAPKSPNERSPTPTRSIARRLDFPDEAAYQQQADQGNCELNTSGDIANLLITLSHEGQQPTPEETPSQQPQIMIEHQLLDQVTREEHENAIEQPQAGDGQGILSQFYDCCHNAMSLAARLASREVDEVIELRESLKRKNDEMEQLRKDLDFERNKVKRLEKVVDEVGRFNEKVSEIVQSQ